MKKSLFILLSILCFPFLLAAEACDASKNPLLNTLSQELSRNFKTLKRQKPPVYYMSYQLFETNQYYVSANLSGLAQERQSEKNEVDITVRVGSPKLDNTRELKGERNNRGVISYLAPLENTNPLALKNVLWRGTQDAAERAQKEFNSVHNNAATLAENTDKSDDFVIPSQSLFCQQQPKLVLDLEPIKARLIKMSALVANYDFISYSSAEFSAQQQHKYFVDSVGSRIKTGTTLIRYMFAVTGRNKDGMELRRSVIYDGFSMEDMPAEAVMLADAEKAIAELKALKEADVVDPYTGPAILLNKAAGVFFHEVLGHRVEGNRQKSESFGQTFTKKLGQPIVADFLSIVDDPTISHYNGVPLRGYYEYDDEGVKSQRVAVVERGLLKNFLMSGSPINGFPKSNGHGRKEQGKLAFSRMGNLFVIPTETVSYPELEQKLLEEIKRQNKPYGFIVEDISGGFTMTETFAPQSYKVNPLLVWRVYPDGRKEIVRGVDLVGTPLTSFSKIIAAADDFEVFNGSCGAESGWVPVSSVSPSILLSELEIEKVRKSDYKPPVLPPPYADKKGGK